MKVESMKINISALALDGIKVIHSKRISDVPAILPKLTSGEILSPRMSKTNSFRTTSDL